LLGVPPAFITRGGFQFAGVEATAPAERANPWELLSGVSKGPTKDPPASFQRKSSGELAAKAIGDENTVKWILHSDLGKELEILGNGGEPATLSIAALLQDSIFQSELLISEQDFLNLFPQEEGYRFFLIDGPPDRAAQVRAALETNLAGYGFIVSPTAERLES